ncbi:dNTP triphosphohydrolase, broad substrate specificity [hydrothermal vent metagenome]|uniref:DNTP triphosphohydrolase, broad substrate specificity n=1 Tax=hydrothermal vent metagenome TaxID=652676 RepID=A0A3B0ZT83_9ZZZZ
MTSLAPYACCNASCKGRQFHEPCPEYRSEYQRDRDRIIHSSAFRRLEYKTQVFVNHEGDMFRTRLTHSIEVAQISRTIARILNVNEELAETIALAHDVGHTPFGHAGQDALNACMTDYDGFEHNLQSLRVVDVLEQRYADFDGLNLTFESREGIIKHCAIKKAAAIGDVGERFLNRTQSSLEAQLVDLADQIAYNNHDVDDGLRAGLISIKQLRKIVLFNDQYVQVIKQYPDLPERRLIYEITRRLINNQVVDLVETTKQNLIKYNIKTLDDVRKQKKVIVQFSKQMSSEILSLKQFLRKELYQHYRVHRMSNKSKKIISNLFEAFMTDIKLLPPEHQQTVHVYQEQFGEKGQARVVSDYIAGMTDRFAITEYGRIFNPSELT